MNTNLKRNFSFMATTVILLNITSCGKYEDGPAFSLRSKEGRLVGEWEVVDIDGSSGIALSGIDITMEFENDGDAEITYTYNYYGFPYSESYDGEWEWEDDKGAISFEYEDGEDIEFEIKRLTNDELWLEDEDGVEFELEKE